MDTDLRLTPSSQILSSVTSSLRLASQMHSAHNHFKLTNLAREDIPLNLFCGDDEVNDFMHT